MLEQYQQVAIMLIACICNPIFINTFVVFIRLYWFEKRFQNVVQDARNILHSRTRSRTKSEAKQDMERDLGHEESRVGDREIKVLRNAIGLAEGEKTKGEILLKDDQNGDSGNASSSKNGVIQPGEPLRRDPAEVLLHRDIMFADEVVSPSERLPEPNKEQSIAFVENQRNPKDRTAFRIPGPRDYELGFAPERIEDANNLEKQVTNEGENLQTKRQRTNSLLPADRNEDGHPSKQRITINAPDFRRRPNTGASAYNLRQRRGSDVEAEASATGMGNSRARLRPFGSFLPKEREEEVPMPYLSWTPTVGRNSTFVDLTEDQREELGGIEYRALKLLAIILICYFVGFHLLGMICLLPWIVRDAYYSHVVSSVGVNPVWWGFFTPASLFNDLGFTLTPDSMISFRFAVFPLVLGIFLIVIGNTGFPCMLRFVIWFTSKCVPYRSGIWEELHFLLDHPRRCFTLLFPSGANWWLFWVLIGLNSVDLIFFIILDLNDLTVTNLPPGFRILDGLFQAASTRTAGFAVVNLAELHPAIQVSYLIMMYISVFPIAISLRKTNVYEEKSLSIYTSAEDDENSQSSYLGTHLRRQLSFDLWYVFLGFFLITIIEGPRLENTNDYQFTLFSVLFEIVSAYGTVGLSLGYPGANTSFSGQFKPLSKLIIIAMQIRGRHRGLPYALDRAILLPSESLHKKEDADAMRRLRRNSNVNFGDDEPGAPVLRTSTGLSRRESSVGEERLRSKIRPKHVSRLIAGALGAGPLIPREKKP